MQHYRGAFEARSPIRIARLFHRHATFEGGTSCTKLMLTKLSKTSVTPTQTAGSKLCSAVRPVCLKWHILLISTREFKLMLLWSPTRLANLCPASAACCRPLARRECYRFWLP